MIVVDLNIMRSVRFKPKADTPLVIDAHAPLSGPLARKRLKAVGWRKSEVLNYYGGVNLRKSYDGPFLNVLRQFSGPHAPKQSLGFLASERPYHKNIINKMFTEVKTQMTTGLSYRPSRNRKNLAIDTLCYSAHLCQGK